MTPHRRTAGGEWPPFWLALPAIAAYPLRGSAGVTLAGLVLLALLGRLPVLGWVFDLLAWLTALKYGLETLRDTAHGNLRPPRFGLDLHDSTLAVFFLTQLAAASLVLVAWLLAGPDAALVIAALGILVLPAIAMSLAIDEAFGRALSPATWVETVGRLGMPYLVAVVLLAAVLAGAGLLAQRAGQRLPGPLGVAAAAAISFWSLIAGFHLLGYLVHQYRDRLGFEPIGAESPRGLLDRRDDELLRTAQARLDAGDAKAARALIEAELGERALGEPVHEFYRGLLRQAGDRPALLAHGRLRLRQLVVDGDARGACALARECLQLDAQFAPLDGEDLEFVHRAAFQSGQSQLALDALRALIASQPRHRSRALWCFEAARLEADRFGRVQAARTLLDQAQAGDAEPDLAAAIAAYRERLPAG